MNHLFVTQDFPPDLGGMSRRHVELCRRLAAHPGEQMVVSTVAAHDADDHSENFRIVRERFPFSRANRFVNQLRWARSLSALARDADVIHCGNIRPSGYAVWWVSRNRPSPYLLYVNGGDVLRERRKIAGSGLKKRAARAIFGNASGVVANSKWTAEVTRQVMREAGVSNPPTVAPIDLGTNPVRFSPSHDRGQLRARFGLGAAPMLLTVARLVPHKGQDVTIRAIALLARDFPDLRYVMVGEGEDEQRLRDLADELLVRDRVLFAGALSDAEVADAYATATLYVGVSRLDRDVNVEGFGIAFVEAGASGVPSVAGDSGGGRSAVRDGETGLLVPPEDPAAVAKAIRTLLRDDDRRRAMGKEARRLVETYYNWDRVARETLDFTRDAAAEHAARTKRT